MDYLATFISADDLRYKEIITGPEHAPPLQYNRAILPLSENQYGEPDDIKPLPIRQYRLEAYEGNIVIYREQKDTCTEPKCHKGWRTYVSMGEVAEDLCPRCEGTGIEPDLEKQWGFPFSQVEQIMKNAGCSDYQIWRAQEHYEGR